MSSHSDSSDPNAETVIRGSSAANPVPPPSGDAADFPTVPGYELIERLHHGGQGVVYHAQQQATRRSVAIKFMHAHAVGSEPERVRFEREVQILGQLRHPGIVSIHDSGMARSSFYYVMDFINGKPLDAYMAAAQLDVHARIELFAQICDAVHAAHLAGVIHRDLKPNNILVDENGQPRILDFGLAKVTLDESSDLTVAPVMTMTGQFFGSLPWASPEQAEAIPSKIDLRTDVYALGVVLYQLLTDRFPYEVTGNMRDTMENIMHAEPRPPRSVNPEVDDELETITLKCLSKERDRRYQIAGEIARDIRHYLAGEPIEAKRDSGWYVLRKTLRRYRVPVLVSFAFLIMLVASLVFTATAWRAAADQRDRAVSADQAKEEALELARQQADLARLRAAEATRYLHAIQVSSALDAVQRHDWSTAERLLGETMARGEAEGEDLRGFAWRHVAHRVRGHADAGVPTLVNAAPKESNQRLSPDGSLLVTWRGGLLRVYNAAGELLRQTRLEGPIQDVAFSADGNRCAIGLPEVLLAISTANLRNPIGGGSFRRVPLTSRPSAVAIDNGGLLAYGTADGQVAIVRGVLFGLARDLLGGGIEVCPDKHGSAIRSLSFQGAHSLLASVSWSRRGTLSGVFGQARGVEIRVWRVPTIREAIPASVADLDPDAVRLPPPSLLLTLRPQTKLTQVAFSPDAPILAAWGGSYVRVWSLRLIEQATLTGGINYLAEANPLQVYASQQDELSDPSEIPGTTAAWSTDGRQFLCGDKDGQLQLFDVTPHPNATADLHEVFRGQCEQRDPVASVAFVGQTPSATVIGGDRILSWNLTHALPYVELPGNWDELAFSPVDRRVWTLRRRTGNTINVLNPVVAQVSCWALDSSQQLFSRALETSATQIHVAADGAWLALSGDAGLQWIDGSNAAAGTVSVRPGTVARFGPRGDLILARGRDAAGESAVWSDFRLFQTNGGSLDAQSGWKPPERLRQPRFSSDGVWLLGGEPDGRSARTIPVAGGTAATFKTSDPGHTVDLLAGHAGRGQVLLAYAEGRRQVLRLGTTADRAAIELQSFPADTTITDGHFSPGGDWVAAVVRDAAQVLRLLTWNTRTGALSVEASLPRDLPGDRLNEWCAFSPDEDLLAIPGSGQIRLVDLHNGQDRMRLPAEELARMLRFAPDGTALGAVLTGGRTRVWLAERTAGDASARTWSKP